MGFTDFVSNATYDLYEAKLEKEVLEGQMPKHVAIIMDGNRRYAKDVLKTDDTSEGHRRGKDKVEEVLNWCLKLNIRVLTIYALSTENFSREDSEVDYLLKLIIETMYELADDERVHVGHSGQQLRLLGVLFEKFQLIAYGVKNIFDAFYGHGCKRLFSGNKYFHASMVFK